MLFFEGLLVLLTLLLNRCHECISIKIYLLAKIVIFILNFLQSLLLGRVLVRRVLVDLRLLFRIDAIFLLAQHRDRLLVLVGIVRLQALYRFVNLCTFLFVFALYLTLLYNFVLGLLLDELVDCELLLLLEGFELNSAIIEDFLDLWVQVFEVLLELPFH